LKTASSRPSRELFCLSLFSPQAERNGQDFVAENEAILISSGAYLLEAYLGNVWPKMNIFQG